MTYDLFQGYVVVSASGLIIGMGFVWGTGSGIECHTGTSGPNTINKQGLTLNVRWSRRAVP